MATKKTKRSLPAKKITKLPTSQGMSIDFPKNPLNNFNLDKRKLPFALAFAILVLLLVLLFRKGIFVAALVNGEPISRLSVVQSLEKQSGKATLESLITKKLILQEAKKRNVTITKQQVDGEIKKIETNLKTQGTTLDQALTQQNMTKDQLNDEIKIQLYIQEMVGKNIKVTDKEITNFITANKTQFPEGTTETQMKQEALSQLKSQKLQENTQKFIDEIQKKAKISHLVNY